MVRAVAGERAAYRPVESCLTATATPSAVATAMLDLAPFSSFYLADLDAITGAGQDCNQALLLELCATLARRDVAELWLDAGTAPWRRDFVDSAGDRASWGGGWGAGCGPREDHPHPIRTGLAHWWRCEWEWRALAHPARKRLSRAARRDRNRRSGTPGR